MECSCPWAGGMSIRHPLNPLGRYKRRGFDYRVYGKGFIGDRSLIRWIELLTTENRPAWLPTDWELNTRDTLTLQGDMYQGLDGERVAISLFTPPSREVFNGAS